MNEYENNLERFVGIMMPTLDEAGRRVFLAVLSEYLGHGAISELSKLTGVSRSTINSGRRDASLIPIDPKARSAPKPIKHTLQRASGGGRKSVTETNPEIFDMLCSLIDGQSGLGTPEPLTWTTRSLRNIQETLQIMGMTVSHTTVATLLSEMGFRYRRHRLSAGDTVTVREKEAQFRLINDTAMRFIAEGNPVIIMDFKWKVKALETELLEDTAENTKCTGESSQSSDPARGWRYTDICISDDTAPYAVNAVRTWWETTGKTQHPGARRLYITTEGDGEMELGLWKCMLARFGRESGLTVTVSHFPTGTSKWNAVENQLNTYFSINSRNEANRVYVVNIGLVSYSKGLAQSRVNEIGATPVEIPAEGLWNYQI